VYLWYTLVLLCHICLCDPGLALADIFIYMLFPFIRCVLLVKQAGALQLLHVAVLVGRTLDYALRASLAVVGVCILYRVWFRLLLTKNLVTGSVFSIFKLSVL